MYSLLLALLGVAAARGFEITFPPVLGYVTSNRTIEIEFDVEGPLVVDFVGKQDPITIEAQYVSMVLTDMEPGTHVLGLNGENQRREIAFDVVVEPTPILYPPVDRPRADFSTKKVKVGLVGSMRLDGQKTIWLEQLRRLPENINMTFLSFEPLSGPLPDMIPIVSRPIPPISRDDIDFEYTPQALDLYLMKHFHAPKWANDTWTHLIENLKGFDIVVFANARDTSDLLLTKAARLAGVKKIVGELPNLFPHAGVDVDLWVAPSRYVASFPYDAPVVVIPPGVDTELFRPRLLEDDAKKKKIVGFIGRVAPEKSINLFIRAASVVKNAQFVVVGDGEAMESAKAYSNYLGVDVEFTGRLHGEALASRLRSFDVVVNPSLRDTSETFCIANIEAMSSGVAVVSFGVGGVGEYLQPGYNGLLATNVDSLSAQIQLLVDNDLLRHTLSSNARETALQYYKVEDQMSAYASLYTS